MFKEIMEAIIDEFNTRLCLRDIANHWRCRCTVPGPGMRQAGEILVKRYLENGAAMAELIPYPADDKTEFLDGARNQLEWRPHNASLEIVSPVHEMICRYEEEPLCLVCYSVATPPEGLEAEIVVPQGPLSEDNVEAGQWAGKIVFTDQFPASVAAAVGKSGALGLISDCISPPWLQQFPPVREPEDVPDLTMWTIFSGTRHQPQIFGFNLTPRQGRRLRQLIEKSAEPVRLRAYVQAETVEGSSDFVHATLPGTDLAQEEIWVLAHLSEPGARDNASGCCVSLELVRTLSRLIKTGKLPPLRRTIRFMHAVEVSGFLPYIHENKERLSNIRAGLCADSIAEDFGRCGGQILLFLSPEYNASFIDGFCQTLLQAVAAEPARRFCSDNYAIFPWSTRPFWGNDAFISDGYFDIPTPQISAWPDKHYHSNLDVPADIDENSLGRMGAVMGTYLYFLATAGAEEARWLGLLARQDFMRRIVWRQQEIIAQATRLPLEYVEAQKAAAELWHLGLQGQDAIIQACRFAPQDARTHKELQKLAAGIADFARQQAQEALRLLGGNAQAIFAPWTPPDCPEAQRVPRRLRWRLPSATDLPAEISQNLAAIQETCLDPARVWLWINGRRSLGEIAERLQLGRASTLEAVCECVAAWQRAGLIEWA